MIGPWVEVFQSEPRQCRKLYSSFGVITELMIYPGAKKECAIAGVSDSPGDLGWIQRQGSLQAGSNLRHECCCSSPVAATWGPAGVDAAVG